MPEERGLWVERQVSVAFDFNGMHFDEGGDSSMRSLLNNRQDFASSRLRVSQKVGGTRRREVGDSSMNVEDVSSVVVDMAFHLHRGLGPGLLESVYEDVLVRMLEERGLRVERQVSVAFDFNDMHFDEGLRVFASSRE